MSQASSQHRMSFHSAAVRSGLVSKTQWEQAVAAARQSVSQQIQSSSTETSSAKPTDDAIADYLVHSGITTNYQIQQLRAGRSKLSLGPYVITDWIGQGGMGQVFKAVHRVMGRQCAVKVLPLEKSTELSRESFQREIRLQAELDCPYLVRAFDAGHDGSVHYLVTEYIPGTDLRKLVRNHGPLAMEQAALVVSQAALGLQYAHNLGLVHRDVKPGNILVTPEGLAKVSDVGLAAWSMGLDDDPRAGKIVGTADYLSPEQIRSPMSVGPASDIYSLGCTLYYAVTGKVPFPGGDARSKCRRHCEQTPLHPRNFAPDLSEDFVDVIADMMEKDVSARITTAAEVAERLEPWSNTSLDVHERPLRHQVWTPPPPPKEPPQIKELSEFTETANSGTLSLSDASVPMVPTIGEPQWPTPPRKSPLLAIALALSIAIPISLLAGAIIGFFVRDRM